MLMRRTAKATLVAAALIALVCPAAVAAPQTAVSYVSARTSTTILAVNSPAAIYNAKTDAGPECDTSTYLVIYATWNVKQVSASSVNLYSVSLRVTNHRSASLAGGFIESPSGTVTYRSGSTTYAAGVRTLTYTINRTMSLNSYKQLRLRQNFDFGGLSGEPVYCNYNSYLGQWLQVR
jgi:hypothetical protein